MKTKKILARERRHKKIRSRLSGTIAIPRLSVYRSNRYLYAQIIDDDRGVSLVASSDFSSKKKGKVYRASEVGKVIASRAREKKITRVVFDRGGFAYHGRIKALAEAAREGGLIF